jgi:Fe2+ transport system protein B
MKSFANMRSKTATRILSETPEEVKEKVRQIANDMVQSTKTSLIDSIDLQIKGLKSDNEMLKKFLCQCLDEFEGRFDSDEKCDSIEIAEEYIEMATYMKNVHGRKYDRIRHVQEWIDNYLPFTS